MTAIERTKTRVNTLIDWLRDLQSVDPQADRDYPEDLYNLAIDDLHAISFEYQTLARELERLRTERNGMAQALFEISENSFNEPYAADFADQSLNRLGGVS
jgi:hypothetical protein